MLESTNKVNFIHTKETLTYAFKSIIQILKIDELKIQFVGFQNSNVEFLLTYKGNTKMVEFKLIDSEMIHRFLKKEADIFWYKSFDHKIDIPVLNHSATFGQYADDKIHIQIDILSMTFLMLSRYEEHIATKKDQHGRFEYKESIACNYGFNHIPVVDEYALLLKQELQTWIPEMVFGNVLPSIIPSHDIDEIYRYQSFYKSCRTLVGDLVRYKSLPLFINSLISYIKTLGSKVNDPYLNSIGKLIKTSEKFGVYSIFYFMAAKASKFNDGYLPIDKNLTRYYDKITESNMFIGLHGGYETYNDKLVYGTEKAALEQAIHTKVNKNRQHFLRFDVNCTYKILEDSGITYDSSLCYAEAEGFRAGTSHPFNPYNFETNQTYKLVEHPLIVMDVTLTSYKNYTDSEALHSMKMLYDRVKAVGGEFHILWHNTYVDREPKRFKNIYCSFLEHTLNYN